MPDSDVDILNTHSPGPVGLVGLFEQHRPELRRFLLARCGNASDAEDLLQDMWLKLATLRPGPVANARAYLFRIANNLVLDRARASIRSAARDGRWVQEELGLVAMEDRVDPALRSDEELAALQEQALLWRAIAQLPDGAQRALRLYRFEGLNQSEVADVMGVSRSAVEKHLAVAMKHLRRIFAGWGDHGLAASKTHGQEHIGQQGNQS